MNHQHKPLWDDLNDLLMGLDATFSGPEEAAIGSYGRRLLIKIIQGEIDRGGKLPDSFLDPLWAGLDSLVSDYRISSVELNAMRLAHFGLRCHVTNSDPSNGGTAPNRH